MTTAPTLRSRSFVLGMLHDDGSLVASEVYDVGEALGFTVHQIRLVFARLVQEGLFNQTGRGRKAILHATSRHELLHGPEAEWLTLAYEQDAGLADWDGIWHLVAFSVEEERRALRTALRDVLLGMGAAPLAGGIYVQALDWDSEVRRAVRQLDVADNVVLAAAASLEVGGTTSPRAVAARLWPVDEIAALYRRFVSDFEQGSDERELDAIAELANGMALVAGFEKCARLDPLLPPQLLPPHWPGRRAREVLRDGARRLVKARRRAAVPALFSRYDKVFIDSP
jgi:phenylacetic acid degradation operon negative regulatory protein